MKKFGFVIIFMILFSFISYNVKALEQRYTSYIEMYGGSSLIGQAYDFSYVNHKISMNPTYLELGYGKVDLSLRKRNIFGVYSEVAFGQLSLDNLGGTFTKYFGNCGSGNFRYHFFTGTSTNWYGSFKANPVYLYSYE